MASGKQLPGYETYVSVPAFEDNGVVKIIGDTVLEFSEAAFAANPTQLKAILNKWANVLTPGQAGGNISRALRDDVTLNPTESDTDDERDVTQKGQAANMTTENFEFQANTFVDEDRNAAGVFNMARLLFAAPDLPHVHFRRIGPDWDVDFATGDTIDAFYAWTDNPIVAYPDSANMTIGQTFVPKNSMVLEHVIG
jgi:hypothetical protein